jgi:hypothetical protein
MKKIIGVAIKYTDIDGFCSLKAPNRHHDVIKWMYDYEGCQAPITGEQGFIDEDHNFLSRTEALERAIKTNQIIPGTVIRSGILFSEDLW